MKTKRDGRPELDRVEEIEAVKKAAMLEANGHRFYAMLAERTRSPQAREVFARLAEDELQHKSVIEKEFFAGAGLGGWRAGADEKEADERIAAQGAPDLFARRVNVERLLEIVDTTAKALILARDAELHAVRFFRNLSLRARSARARQVYAALVEEEQGHVDMLNALLAEEGAG